MSTTRGWLRRAFLPASIALLLVAGAAVPLPAFIERPGIAAGIPACVAITERPEAAVNGDYLFTTVAQRTATVFELVLAGLREDQRVVMRDDLLRGTRRDRYLRRQRQVFIDSTDRALVVALAAAGLPAEVDGRGVDIVEVVDGAPADGVLRAGDVIVAVDGQRIGTDADLIAAVTDSRPLELRVQRDGTEVTEVVTPQVQQIDDERRPMIGVRISTREPQLQIPLGIDVASGRVGGPSAGLMIALSVLDLVDDGDLARGRRIAGTGTLALDGSVGVIDGIELKVPAAVGEGADVFLAPASQAEAARSAVPDGSGLTVLGVETFDDAVAALARGGGAAQPATSQPCRYQPDA